MTVNKKRFNFSLSEEFVAAMRELSNDSSKSASFLIEEYITKMVILPDLGERIFAPGKLTRYENDTRAACELWVALRLAEKGENGYKIIYADVQNHPALEPQKMIVGVQGFNENDEIVMY